ncbi:MAG: type II toxin-antitoxin system VapB family antitoxin [Gammaproteobacteria bacterium]|nr:type II toxin-antitoxin system VapB family antitoxin [Gammaproteobacteria bacterium]
MATNLALDDALIEETRRIGQHKTKKEAVTSALREYVRHRRQLAILDLKGQVPFDEDYDCKSLRHRKPAAGSWLIPRFGRLPCGVVPTT